MLVFIRLAGIAVLAARPTRQLSIADFADKVFVFQGFQGKAFCSHKTAPALNPCRKKRNKQKRKPRMRFPFLWCGRQELKTSSKR